MLLGRLFLGKLKKISTNEVLPLGTRDCQNSWRRKAVAVICMKNKRQEAKQPVPKQIIERNYKYK